VAKFNKIQNNFKSGQLSQLLDGRVELDEYRNGLKTMKNAYPMRQGGAQKRAGLKFIEDLTASLPDRLKGSAMRMVPFTTFDKTKYIFILVADRVSQAYSYVPTYNLLLKEVNGEFQNVTDKEYALWDSLSSGASDDTLKNIHWAAYGNEVFFARGYNTYTSPEKHTNPAVLYKYFPEVSITAGSDVDFANDKFLLRGTFFNVKGQTDIDSDTITEIDHGLKNNTRVLYTKGPTSTIGGLTTNTYYYVVNATQDTFQLADTKGGAAKSISDAGDDADDQKFTPTVQHSFVDGDEVQLFNDQTPAALPTGLSVDTSYYVKRIQDDEIELYDDANLSVLSTFSDVGTGVHTIEHVVGKFKFHTMEEFLVNANGSETDTVFERHEILARPFLEQNLITTATLDWTAGAGGLSDTLESPEDFFTSGHVGSYFILNDGFSTAEEIGFRVDYIESPTKARVTAIVGATTNLTQPVSEWKEAAWSGERGYPGAVTTFEGRLIYGGTESQPGIIWLSKTEDITVFKLERLIQDESTNKELINFFGTLTADDPKEYGFKDTIDRRISFLKEGRALEVGTSRDVKILNAPDGLGAEAGSPAGQIPYFTVESETGAGAIMAARADQSTLYSEVLIGVSNFTLDTEIETRDRYISKQLSLLNEEIIDGEVELFYYDSFRRILYIILKQNGDFVVRGLYFDNIDDTAAWFTYDFTDVIPISSVYSLAGFDESTDIYMLTTRKKTSFDTTVNVSTEVFTANGHGLSNGDEVQFITTDTLPAGLSINTTYHVITSTTNTFQVEATLGGGAIDITNAGVGTHTVVTPRKEVYLEKLEGASTKGKEALLDYLDCHVEADASGSNILNDANLVKLDGLVLADGSKANITVVGNLTGESPARPVIFRDLKIDGGQITLPYEVDEYVAGITYEAELETMLVDGGLNVEGSSQGQVKRVDEVTLRMWNSTNLEIGDSDGTFPVKFDDDSLYTGDKVVKFDQGPRTDNRVKILSKDPKPMFLTALITKGVTYE
jgi:hypothetical protein